MNLLHAEDCARALLDEMRPYCERCHIAGSVRRRKPECKDIEIVAVPRWKREHDLASLFVESVSVNLLFRWAQQSAVKWIKPGVSEVVSWTIKPVGKYWRGLLSSGIKLDLFLASPDNFGLIYLIRTGAAEFSSAILGYAKNHTPYQTERSYYDEHRLKGETESYLVERATGHRVLTPEESDVFALLGLEYVEPQLRLDGRAIRRKR